jgi:hypothetical protein
MKRQYIVENVGIVRRYQRIMDFHYALQHNPMYFELRLALRTVNLGVDRVNRSSNKSLLYQVITRHV